MSSLFSLIKDRINFWLLLPGLILFSILTGMIAIDSDLFLSIQILKNLSTLPQPKTTIILISLLIAISAYYLFLFLAYSKKANLKDYELINPPGFMKHKTKGGFYCQPCLIGKDIASELSTITKKEMICRICGEKYQIDYSVLISDSYLSKKWDEAVQELALKDDNG
jgi:hypothetical protein